MASIFLCLIVLEIINVLSTVEDDILKNRQKNDEIEINLFKSYNNYGFGLDKFSRIQRFLWWRRFALFFEGNKEKLEQSIKDDEKLMKKLVESSDNEVNGNSSNFDNKSKYIHVTSVLP